MIKNWFNLPKVWWKGLLIIFIIYSLFYLFFVESKVFSSDQEQIYRHLIRFLTTLAVYIIGFLHLRYIDSVWMKQLWHFVHISLFGCLIVFAGIKWFTPYFSPILTYWGALFQEILISPTLYIGMGILNKIYQD